MRISAAGTLHLRPYRRSYSSSSNLIQIRSGTFYGEHPSSVSSSTSNPPLFPDLTFELKATSQIDVGKPVRTKDHWAIIGASDTTAFLDVLRGNLLCIPPNARTYPYLASDDIDVKDARLRVPSNAIQYVGFNTGNKAGLGGVGGTQGAYLSARYESRREETDWSVLQYLKGETELNPSEQLSRTVKDETLLDRVITDLRLGRLLNMPVSNLSNGQTRRCRIAKALLSEPKCLLLDEPFMGLDPPTLVTLSPILRDLAYRSNPLLVLGLRPQDPVPDWITSVIVLGKNHKVGLMAGKSEVLNVLGRWAHSWKQEGLAGKHKQDLNDHHRWLHETFGRPFEGFGDTLAEKGILPSNTPTSSLSHREAGHQIASSESTTSNSLSKSLGKPLIELESITLSYGTKVVLGHKTPSHPSGGLTLTIKQGTRLALLGSNGSGKTTLLSLLTSDHPQSYSLPIKFFGRTRLPQKGKPGLSLWEIQRRIGHSAPEVHAFYPKTHTVRRVLESAWAETYSSKPNLDSDASALIDRVLMFWAPELRQQGGSNASTTSPDDLSWANDKETHYFKLLPFGTQRLLLLLRAIIKQPDIVILDEAFSGLDSATREKAMTYLEFGEMAPEPAMSRELRDVMVNMSGDAFTGLTNEQALVVVSHVREEIPRCVDEWVRLPSEEEAVELGKDVVVGRADDVGGGRGLRSTEGWGEVWGM